MLLAIAVAALAAAGFIASSLFALRGSDLSGSVRAFAIAIAAGILLAVAFGDLFPESVEMADRNGIAGFIAGFTLLFLIELFTQGHTHHSPDEPDSVLHQHDVTPFLVGLGLHNLADGFAIAVSGEVSETVATAASIGVLVHQIPVGLSVAAVLMAARMSRGAVTRTAFALGLMIPVGAIVAVALPDIGDTGAGVLVGIAGGLLTYLGAAHLLPEAQVEHPSRATGFVFTIALLLTAAGIFMMPEH